VDSASLGVPPAARVGTGFSDGLFLIAGQQGSGRTTTLHAILWELMASKPVHVVRVLRSVDYDLPAGKGTVTTLRVGRDTPEQQASET
jgi:Tfp pilus assembly pilus retraction ATPase PilT